MILSKLVLPLPTVRVGYSSQKNTQSVFEADESDPPKIRSGVEAKTNSLSVTIENVTECKEFPSLRSLLLDTFDVVTISLNNISPTTPFQLIVHQRANLIAARTRRGAGNVIVTCPTGHQLLSKEYSGFLYTSTSALNSDEILIMYEGQNKNVLDGPFAAEIANDGSVRAVVLENTSKSLGDARDYGVILRTV